MAEELMDVVDSVLDHRRALEGQAPRDRGDVLVEAHRLKHLGPEHAAVADFHPALHARVVAENLHAGLGVRVVGWLELDLGDAWGEAPAYRSCGRTP